MAKQKDSPKPLTITNVPSIIHQDLHNIADNIGIPLSAFLKPELRKIADSYPAHMKKGNS